MASQPEVTSCGQCEVEDGPFEPPPAKPSPSLSSVPVEFDFVERPSQDFFCPVSLELLLEPQLTSCCGHHLSLEVANRLQRDGKTCPMCNGEGWGAFLDKYHRRRVHQVHVRCWHADRGCVWVGEVGQLTRHANLCEKRPWMCHYCGLLCERGEGEGKHWPECAKFPEPCPNGCEVGRVERCGMEQHRRECPLEPVACEMKEFGCSVVVPRKELATHMRESELHHLTAMTALNLRLTRQLQQDSTERDQKIKTLQQGMADQKEKFKAIDRRMLEIIRKVDLHNSVLGSVQKSMSSVSASVLVQECHLAVLNEQASSMPRFLAGSVEAIQDAMAVDTSCSGTEVFTFNNYSLFKGSSNSQYSAPFFSHFEGYKLRLKIKYYSAPDNDIGAFLCLMMGEYDRLLRWPVSIRIRLEVVNQADDCRHVAKGATCTWELTDRGEQTIQDPVMKYATLERELENVQFVMDDTLEFKVTVTIV